MPRERKKGRGAPTPAPTNTRPAVTVRSQPTGDGRLRVTVTAGCGAIQTITIGAGSAAITNAVVEIEGGPRGIVGSRTVSMPGGATTATLYITRQQAGQATTVPLTIVDGCGEWRTFVGGGPTAF